MIFFKQIILLIMFFLCLDARAFKIGGHKWVSGDGSPNQCLKTDGNGNLGWISILTPASLSGTAPITYNSGTGAIGISQSSSSTNGYLSSADWTTFNSKVGESSTNTLTNKSIDADDNTITDIDNNEIKAGAGISYSKLDLANSIINADIGNSAAIGRGKMANGPPNEVVINDGGGAFSSEAQLAKTRGGTGISSTATFPASGEILTADAAQSVSNKNLIEPLITTIVLPEISTPANPGPTKHKLYKKSDGKLYSLNQAGVEQEIGAAQGVTNFSFNDPNSAFNIGLAAESTDPAITADRDINLTLAGDTNREIYLDGNIYVENGDISTNGNLATTIPFEVSGGGSMTLNTTNTATSVTVPPTGTLATRAETETLENKTLDEPILVDPVTEALVLQETSTPAAPGTVQHKLYVNGSDDNLYRIDTFGVTQRVGQDVVDTHSTDTTSVHGITDTSTLATKTGTEDISGKTFTDAITLSEIATPSSPAASKHKIYPKSDGKLYKLNSSGTEVEVGSGAGGGSGGINYFSANPDAESGVTGWTTYADGSQIPVDLQLGTASATISRTTSNPIRGTGSFLYTAGAQGNGASYTITPDRGDVKKSTTLYGSFDFEYSNTVSALGNYTVWVYDVANSALIQPVNYQLPTGIANVGYKHIFSFQIPSNGTTFRVAIHQAVASPGANVIFDNLIIGPLANSAEVRPVIARYKCTTADTTTTTNTINYDTRVIDTYSAVTTGATDWKFTAPLPGFYNVSASMMASQTASLSNLYIYKNGSPALSALVVGAANGVSSAGSTIIELNAGDYIDLRNGSGSTGTLNGDAQINWISIYRLPALIGGGDSAGAVAFRAYDGTQSFASIGPTDIVYTTKEFDPASGYNASNGIYTVQHPGYYRVTAAAHFNSDNDWAAGEQAGLALEKNGTIHTMLQWKEMEGTDGSISIFVAGSGLVYANAGDTLNISLYNYSGGTITLTGDNEYNYFFADRISGSSSQSSSPDTVSLKYNPSSGQTITNSGSWQNMAFATRIWDSTGGGSFDGTVFTAPVSGQYLFTLTCETADSSSGLRYWGFKVNGINHGCYALRNGTPNPSPMNCVGRHRMLAGQTMNVIGASTTSTLLFCGSDPLFNNIAIDRVGNY